MDTQFDIKSFETITVEIQNNVGKVSLNRPEVLNVLTTECAMRLSRLESVSSNGRSPQRVIDC